MISNFLLVTLGGGLGAAMRYGFSLLPLWSAGFPYATLAINIIGSFLIGLCARWLPVEQESLRLFLMTGILGGFTTFSAFSLEALRLWVDGNRMEAGLYCLLSVGLCLVGVALGDWVGRLLSL